jgi:phosphatidylserine decarboxylase
MYSLYLKEGSKILAKGSESWLFGSFVFTIIVGIFTPFITIGIVSMLFLLIFFRDPERSPESTNCSDMLSPADGRILRAANNKLSIFMNVHNVHVNRAPLEGKIKDIKYRKGSKFPAFSKDSDKNERNDITITTNVGDITVTQISGALIRRIVCYIKKSEKIQRGQRIGMIRFGSRVDVTLPDGYTFIVTKGQRVKAGKTVIAMCKKGERT